MRWVGNLIDSIQTYIHKLLVNDGGDDDEPPLDCYFTNVCICAFVDRKSTHELC